MTEKHHAAVRLHRYLTAVHWNGEAIVGPDPGIRLNARVGRFVKSYTRWLGWSDELLYEQAQGYWIASNWELFDLRGDETYREIALTATEAVLGRQTSDGYWPYPNPEWKGRVATVEGCYAALSLLEAFDRAGDDRFIQSALAWHRYMSTEIGFRRQPDPGMLAVNYFAGTEGWGGGVPNNSTLVLGVLARYAQATDDETYLDPAPALIAWLKSVQGPNGEFPYSVGKDGVPSKPHFLCFQYHAFEFSDLWRYYMITGDETVLPIMKGISDFLADALTSKGYAKRDCENSRVEVTYYTAAVAFALALASQLGLGDHTATSRRAYSRILELQRPDGSFSFYSAGNYGFLSDRRSYPRYLAMILRHLLPGPSAGRGAEASVTGDGS